MQTTIVVSGMTCAHCVDAVTAELTSGVPGVTGVAVDLPTGQVSVTSSGPLDVELVRAAIEEAGYDLVPATRS